MKRFYSQLAAHGIPTTLAVVALVWIGARFTWLHLPLYPVITASVAAGTLTVGASILTRWQKGPRDQTTSLWIAFGLMLAAAILSATVNITVMVVAILTVIATLAIARYLPQPGYPRAIAFSLIAALPVFTGAAAVDPVLAWQLPRVLTAAAISMLFTLVVGLTDLAQAEREQPDSTPAAASLMAALALWFVLVLTMIIPVTSGWYGDLFRDLAIYALGLPVLGLFILVWGNPTDTMLRIGQITLKVGSVIVLAALVLA